MDRAAFLLRPSPSAAAARPPHDRRILLPPRQRCRRPRAPTCRDARAATAGVQATRDLPPPPLSRLCADLRLLSRPPVGRADLLRRVLRSSASPSTAGTVANRDPRLLPAPASSSPGDPPSTPAPRRPSSSAATSSFPCPRSKLPAAGVQVFLNFFMGFDVSSNIGNL